MSWVGRRSPSLARRSASRPPLFHRDARTTNSGCKLRPTPSASALTAVSYDPGASKGWRPRSTNVSRSKPADRVEAALRKADAKLGRVLAKARTGGASALRQQIKGLQAGLKKL